MSFKVVFYVKGISMRLNAVSTLSVLSVSTIFLFACGGNDSYAPTTITGSAVKGPVDGATVTVRKASDGSVVGTTKTGVGGAYTLSVAYSGDVIIEVSGGTYIDETTGVNTALATPLKAVLSANGTNVTGVVTPLTTMAFTAAFPTGSGATAAAYKTAAANLATQFKLTGVDLTATAPTVTGITNEYGKTLIAVSRYLKDNNTTLDAIASKPLTPADWTNFSGKFSASYNAANGTNATYTIDGGTITTTVTGAGSNGGTVISTVTPGGATISGTGVGGGNATCGVSLQGVYNVYGQSVSFNRDFCVSGLQTNCASGNSNLEQQLKADAQAAQASLPAGVSINYSYQYSASCLAGAYPIVVN